MSLRIERQKGIILQRGASSKSAMVAFVQPEFARNGRDTLAAVAWSLMIDQELSTIKSRAL